MLVKMPSNATILNRPGEGGLEPSPLGPAAGMGSSAKVGNSEGGLGVDWRNYFVNITEVVNDIMAGRTVQAVTAATSTTIDLKAGRVINLSLGTNITAITLTNPSPSGALCQVTFQITNGASYTIAGWPSTTWGGGLAPVITTGAGATDTIILTTTNGGTSWRGYITSQAFA
jgi:hypothetical protein